MTRNTPATRTLHADKVRTVPNAMPASAALALDYTTALDCLGGALQRAFGSHKSAAKKLALVIDRNERTAANLLSKRNLPDALNMLMLMATVPEFAAEVRRLTGMQANMDPEFERDLQRLVTQYQKMRGGE
jgi:hypothetical protein